MSRYSNHPSVIKIKESFKSRDLINSFQFKMVSQSDIEKYRKMIDTKKATGMDMIPAKLVKTASHILSKPLTDAINNSLYLILFFQTMLK